MQNAEVYERARQTCLDRYGVANPMHNPEIAERAEHNGYRYKPYTLPSGVEIKMQGFEADVLDYLFSIGYVRPEELVFGRSNVPEVWYTFGNELKRYYTDFASGPNIMYEVKSTRTMTVHWTRNIAKFMASVYLGYELHVIVWDKKSRQGEKLKAHVIFRRLDEFVDNVLYIAQACVRVTPQSMFCVS